MKTIIQIIIPILFYLLTLKSLYAQWIEVGKPYRFNGPIMALNFVGDNLIAAVQGVSATSGGLFVSTDRGISWKEIMTQNPSYSLASRGSNAFAGTWQGLYISDDYGVTWNRNPILSDNVFVIGSNSQYIFVGNSSGVYLSSDLGINWSKATSSLGNFTIKSIVINGPKIFAASPFNTDNDSYVFRSTDNGKSWSYAKNGLPNAHIISLAMVDNNLFAGTSGYGIFYSSDNGDSWSPINDGFIGPLLFSVFLNLFASTEDGLFVSSDLGKTWNNVNSGLSSQVRSLTLYESEIYIGTSSGIVFKRKLDEMIPTTISDPNNLPAYFRLEQNYPNPFNPITTIKYSTPQTGLVSISVYDALGREIENLVNEEKYAGKYKIEFDGTKLTSGIYFYRMLCGKYKSTKKLILIK